MYDRALRSRLATSSRSVLLLGPRQVGKSVLLGSLQPDLVINLADPAEFRRYAARPEQLQQELSGARHGADTVLLDEVQRVPELLDVVQILLDRRPRRTRFLLSGSSARKLRRGHANLLPGRVHVHRLHPLLACELGRDFDIDRAMAHGTLPGIYSEREPLQRAADLRSYADTYLREEIQAEALVRNIGGFARMLDFVAASSGRVLNLSALCADAGLPFETARRYLDLLEDTLVLHRIPAWSGADRASLIQHPRVYLFDVGVRNALLRRPLDRPLDDERGLLLEHLVASELVARMGTLWPELRVFHYRTRGGAEVDFVLEVGREIWAVEVKSGSRVALSATSGLAAFASRTGRVHRKLVVYGGPRPMRLDDVEVLPIESFLAELPK